jgi:hypothetical protein
VATFEAFIGSLQETVTELVPGCSDCGSKTVLTTVPVAFATATAESAEGPAGGMNVAIQEYPGRVTLVMLIGLPAVAGAVMPMIETALAGTIVKSAESPKVPATGTTQEREPFAPPVGADTGSETFTLVEAGAVVVPPLNVRF